MNNRKHIQIIFFGIALLMLWDSYAQKISYENDSGSSSVERVRNIRYRIVSISSAPSQSTVQSGAFYSSTNSAFQTPDKNTGLNTNGHDNPEIQSIGSPSIIDNNNSHNSEKQLKLVGTQSNLNDYSNSLEASSSNQPMQQSIDRNFEYNNNNINGLYPSSLSSYDQQTLDRDISYNNNQNGGSHYPSNVQPNQEKPKNQVWDSQSSQSVDRVSRSGNNFPSNFQSSHNTNNKNKNHGNAKENHSIPGSINGNSHSNSSGKKNNNGNKSGEKQSNFKSNNNGHSQISPGHQGKKNTFSNGNHNENGTNNRGKAKKRVSQIKYEQYLTSIFPDLNNEDVQEVKDFQGRKLARPGQFPHMGAIGFKNHILNKTEYKCGASLISDIWSITTAHCTKYNGLTPTYVRFGDLNLKAAEEDIDPQTRKISLIVNNPSYSEESLYNDIALLQLDKIVIFTEFVQPIRIWYRDEIPFTMAYAMGFGAVQFAGAQTNRLTQLDLTIIPNDICARQMPKQSNARQGIIDSQICAIDNKKTESDTFQGDSGGPLEISFYGEEGGRQRHYLIGLTSFGVVGTTRLPGVYTRVSSFVDWIEKTVWTSEYNDML